MPTQKKDLAQKIHQVAYLEGCFTLRSGQTSDFYFDKYRFESSPQLLQEVAEAMLPLVPSGIDLIAGLELGGIPIATALSLKTGIPIVFVRKQAKPYGTKALAEGQDIKSKKLLIIEDVITTGGQVLQSVKDLRNRGAIVDHVICVIHRSKESHHPQIQESKLQLHSLFNLQDFESL